MSGTRSVLQGGTLRRGHSRREPPARRRPRLEGLVVLLALATAVAVSAWGLLSQAAGRDLGTALPPYVMGYGPRVTAWVVLSLVVLGAAVALGPTLLRAPGSPRAFAVTSFALALSVALAVGAARRGPEGWWFVFDLGPGGSFEAKNEYLPGLPALDYGAWYFLDRFAEMVKGWPVNVGGHPPGLMLVMHALSIDTAPELAALCIVAAAACAPLAYALGREVLPDETGARIAALLTALSPVVVLFGATSADAVYAAAGLAAAVLLASPRPSRRLPGLVVFALATLGTWALLAIGAWAAILAWRREGFGAAVRLAAACGAAVVALDLALYLVAGYDAIATLIATEELYRNSIASIRPYSFWVIGSPVAWGVMLGPPILAAWLLAVVRGRPEAVALGFVLLVAAVMGFTKAETERIWLPFAPLACVAAAAVVPERRLRAVLVVLAVQALAVELLFDTVW